MAINQNSGRKSLTNENFNDKDFERIVQIELAKIYRGETIQVDEIIKELVHEEMKNIPEEVMKEFESLSEGEQRRSQVHFRYKTNIIPT